MAEAFTYQFFHGLDGDGLEQTLTEYTTGDAASAGWRVHTIMPCETLAHPEDTNWRGIREVQRYSVLLERPNHSVRVPPPPPADLSSPAYPGRSRLGGSV